jgi:hypothetical protein
MSRKPEAERLLTTIAVATERPQMPQPLDQRSTAFAACAMLPQHTATSEAGGTLWSSKVRLLW